MLKIKKKKLLNITHHHISWPHPCDLHQVGKDNNHTNPFDHTSHSAHPQNLEQNWALACEGHESEQRGEKQQLQLGKDQPLCCESLKSHQHAHVDLFWHC